MTYRFATLEDLPAYEAMLRSYLLEQEKNGLGIRFTRKTLDFYRDLARSYLVGSGFGFVILAETEGRIVGMTLCGEDPGQRRVDLTFEKSLMVWICWVEPEHRKAGTGLAMLVFGRPKALEMGFERAAMGIPEGNVASRALTEAFGATISERIYHFELAEEPCHGKRRD